MKFEKINIITGWVVFLIASIIYLLTIEPTSSFWDCGEFIASAYKLEVGHPPGAPFFMLLARLFMIFIPASSAALAVNALSAMCSSFTILFLFWSITHKAKKIAGSESELSRGKIFAIMASGVVGGLAYTFSDSFWFSAVEGEVYAMSSLFTAVVFWAILKWETLANRKGELRWIILIAYLMGLSIGVHLLNLLAIPAIAFVYYFRKYEVSRKGLITTGVISVAILGLIQGIIIPYSVNLAGKFELLFVNDFGLPFNSGVITYAIILVIGIAALLYWTAKKRYFTANTLVVGVMMLLIGYSTFAMIVIRSSANPPMDENNPENLFALLSYLNREQYGDRPLLYGQYFNTPTDAEQPYKDGKDVWVKSFSIRKGTKLVKSYRSEYDAIKYMESAGAGHEMVEEYIESGEKKGSVPNYNSELSAIFPRMYSSQASHIPEYKKWSDYKGWMSSNRERENAKKLEAKRKEYEDKLQQYAYFAENHEDPSVRDKARDEYIRTEKLMDNLYVNLRPTASEDMRFFFSYQVGWMYWRYFMWNYAGKQNDIQGHGDILDGNWLSGVDFIDAERLGNRDKLSETQLNNKGLNHFYFLPLLLGIFGIILQFLKAPKDFVVVALLFVLTGFAIVVYLNQYPLQPRERDYAYVGSFYAFAFWIGLGVYALFEAAKSLSTKGLAKIAGISLGVSAVLYLMETMMNDDHSFSLALFFMSFVGLIALGLMQLLSKSGTGDMPKAAIAGILCLTVPLLMAAEGWDDHTRAKRRTAVDFAKNYLDSLDPNAILFTNGDNDTFPLWYAQEVEGYRTDVRIVNLSLLNTDWYIDQMKRQAYDSAPVPISMEEPKYRQGTRDIVIIDGSRNRTDAYIDINMALDVCLDDSKLTKVGDGKSYNFFPTSKFSIPVDSAKVVNNGTVRPKDQSKILKSIDWEVNRSYLLKNNLVVMDLLATNNWDRPIYFAVTTGPEAYIGLEPYFQLEGLAYRLVPVKHEKNKNPNVTGGIAEDIMFDNVMNKFQWGNMDYVEGLGIYMDENNRRMTTNLRLQMSNLAEKLADIKEDEKAIQVLDKAIEVMPEKNVPYDRVMLPLIEQYYELGEKEKGQKLLERLFALMESDLEYFYSLEPRNAAQVFDEFSIKLSVNGRLEQVLNFYEPDSELAKEISKKFEDLYSRFETKDEEIKRRTKTSPGEF